MRMKKPRSVAGIALYACLFAVCPSSEAQDLMSGAEAGRVIDRDSVKPGSPIPRSMPSVQSDDPVEAGFAAQWVERALPPPFSKQGFALAIIAKKRVAGDTWAYGVERQLRELINGQIAARAQMVSRVFCNSVGCLCYLERGSDQIPDPNNTILDSLKSGWPAFGIKPTDVDSTVSFSNVGGLPVSWALIFIQRPSGP
jgi:hypothetical protein